MKSFLLDEHVPPLYRAQLLRHLPALEIWAVGDVGAPSKGTSDPEILRWCEDHGFMLITNNRHSMPGHLHDHLAMGRHVPGILAMRRRAVIGLVIEDLLLIAEASREDEYDDQIVYIPLDR